MAEWEVKPSFGESETIGRQSGAAFLQVALNPKSNLNVIQGPEFGIKVKAKHYPAMLKSLNIFFSINQCQQIQFRVNVYTLKNHLPDSLISDKDIFLRIENYRTGWSRIDLSPYHVRADREIAVCLQGVSYQPNTKGEAQLNVPVELSLSDNSFFRQASQDKWKKKAMNLSYYVELSPY